MHGGTVPSINLLMMWSWLLSLKSWQDLMISNDDYYFHHWDQYYDFDLHKVNQVRYYHPVTTIRIEYCDVE